MSEMRNIVVVPYNPSWPQMFEEEAAKIAAIFGDQLLAIHHIGSTSIPGISAKPIIDIMPIVRDIEKVDAFNPAMIALGYEPKGENHIPGRRYFCKGGDKHRTHHVHTYEASHLEVKRHLDFRDYLRAYPQVAEAYATLKIKLAQQFPHDIGAYIAGKEPFIHEMIEKAHQWRARGGDWQVIALNPQHLIH